MKCLASWIAKSSAESSPLHSFAFTYTCTETQLSLKMYVHGSFLLPWTIIGQNDYMLLYVRDLKSNYISSVHASNSFFFSIRKLSFTENDIKHKRNRNFNFKINNAWTLVSFNELVHIQGTKPGAESSKWNIFLSDVLHIRHASFMIYLLSSIGREWNNQSRELWWRC